MYCSSLGWLPAEQYRAAEERDEYDLNQSMIFIAMNDDGIPLGTSRLILPGEVPFPIEKYFKLYPKEAIEAAYGKLKFCVEVSRFVVPKSPFYKEHEITMALCNAMIEKSTDMNVTHMFMSTDHRFFRLLKILGLHLLEIGEPEFYMGSKTVPGIYIIKSKPVSSLKNIRLGERGTEWQGLALKSV